MPHPYHHSEFLHTGSKFLRIVDIYSSTRHHNLEALTLQFWNYLLDWLFGWLASLIIICFVSTWLGNALRNLKAAFWPHLWLWWVLWWSSCSSTDVSPFGFWCVKHVGVSSGKLNDDANNLFLISHVPKRSCTICDDRASGKWWGTWP